MLRENNSYCNYVKFIAGRESSLADKSIRMESNLALACTVGTTVSDPQGYNYIYAISMPLNTGYNIASHLRGEGVMSVSSQVVYEEGISIFNGVGSVIANMSTAEAMDGSLSGEGDFDSSCYVLEILAATLDAGSRPSALDIAQEIWQSQLSNYNANGTMGGKLNSVGGSLSLSDIEASTVLAKETTVSSRLATNDTRLNNLDITVSSRLADSDFIEPANSDITAIKIKTDKLKDTWDNLPTKMELEAVQLTIQSDISNISMEITEQDKEDLINRIWNVSSMDHQIEGTIADCICDIKKITINKVTKSGDIITIYESNGITIWKQYNLASGGRVEI